MCILPLLVTGCTRNNEEQNEPAVTIVQPASGDVYEQYESAVNNRTVPDSYTITVTNHYDMHYSDDTMSAYDMDEVFQWDGETAHLLQNIDSNGLRQFFDGYYYDGRLYNTYNNITYYEDMSFEELEQNMLVPVEPAVFPEDMIEDIRGGEDTDGNTSYILTLTKDYRQELFQERYDQYGLDAYDNFVVNSGSVTVTFDTDGHFVGEHAVFETEVTLSSEVVEVIYESDVSVVNIDETAVTISDEQKEEQASYVSFEEIDTDSIQTLTSDDDSMEDTVTDTFKKRLVNRLNYEVQDDGTYLSSFNNDNESYMVDFDNHIFEYSNRSIHYIYNWKSDTGQMGACSLDFTNGVEATDCEDSTLEAIRDVKSWLEMELYYCGLTLEDLQSEA